MVIDIEIKKNANVYVLHALLDSGAQANCIKRDEAKAKRAASQVG